MELLGLELVGLSGCEWDEEERADEGRESLVRSPRSVSGDMGCMGLVRVSLLWRWGACH